MTAAAKVILLFKKAMITIKLFDIFLKFNNAIVVFMVQQIYNSQQYIDALEMKRHNSLS